MDPLQHTGPPQTASVYPTIAFPLCDASQISTYTPPVQVIGATPKNPVKNRVIRTVWISFAVAVPNNITIEMKNGIRTGHFRP
jgi:hypothetical protein